jgi:hypothetical protein
VPTRRSATLPPAPRSGPGREAALVALAAFVALLVLRGAVLLDPPYWDALLGLFPQAHWLAVHGLDPFELLRRQPAYVEGGASTYPFSVVPYLLALLERALPEPEPRLVLLHLASFASAAAACAAVHRLLHPLGSALGWLAAGAFLAQPTVQAMACQIGLEMHLTAACAWSLVATAERRWRAAFVWAAIAMLVKQTGVVAPFSAAVVLGARIVLPRLFGTPARGERAWLAAHAALLLVFVLELVVLARFQRDTPGAGVFAGFVPLLTKRLWTLPEFGLALVALAALAPLAFARRRDRALPIELAVLAPGVFVLSYVGLLMQWDNPLPRYDVVVGPPIVALLAHAAARFFAARLARAAIAALALFGLLNAHGRFHPDRPGTFAAPGEVEPLPSNDGWLLERSMRYRDGLALDQAIAAWAGAHRDAAYVAPWPIQHALVEPSFGYVGRPILCASAETSVAWADPPAPGLDELRARGAQVLWIVTPNDFAGPGSRPRAGDVVVERFAVGRQRAWIVRRERWE